jgi:hypothetical protein
MSTSRSHQRPYFEISKCKSSPNIPNKSTMDTKAGIISVSIIEPSIQNHLVNLLNSQGTIPNYTSIHKNIIPLRGNIIDWLLVVAERLKITQETFFKTIMLFDKYIAEQATEVNDPNKIHFLAVICFFISYKFEETLVMNLDFVEDKLLRFKYTKKEIVSQETEILLTLNFKLNFPSVNTFSNIIIEILKKSTQLPNKAKFLPKLDVIYNFVNKISLFVDEFIFNTEAFKISMINFRTTLMLMKNLNLVQEDELKEMESSINSLANEFINRKQVEIMASGLYLAIMNQEKQGCHQNLFQSYYNNIEKIFKQELVLGFA